MRKILLTAIAMVALGISANAQAMDSLECNQKAKEYADKLKKSGADKDTIQNRKAGYYQGCLDEKAENRRKQQEAEAQETLRFTKP